MKKQQKQQMRTGLVILVGIIIFVSIYYQSLSPLSLAVYPNKDCSGDYVRMCSTQSFLEKKYTEGDFVEYSCESPDTTLYKDATTGQCDSNGCYGQVVGNPYRIYLQPSDSGVEQKFVCYRNTDGVWNMRGILTWGYTYVECTSDDECDYKTEREKYCNGDNLMQRTLENKCTSNECKLQTTSDEVFEVCEDRCEDSNGFASCTSICPTVIGWRVQNNQCVSDSGCDYDDSKHDYYSTLEECKKNISSNYTMALLLLGFLGILGLIIYSYVKSRKK